MGFSLFWHFCWYYITLSPQWQYRQHHSAIFKILFLHHSAIFKTLFLHHSAEMRILYQPDITFWHNFEVQASRHATASHPPTLKNRHTPCADVTSRPMPAPRDRPSTTRPRQQRLSRDHDFDRPLGMTRNLISRLAFPFRAYNRTLANRQLVTILKIRLARCLVCHFKALASYTKEDRKCRSRP